MNKKVAEQFGNIDIYLFDQILKGRFDTYRSVLDVGCGKGRNLHYFLNNDFDVFGIDRDEKCIAFVKQMLIQNNSANKVDCFKVGSLESNPFHQDFDIVICNAVLHFARDKEHFEQMLFETWKRVAPGGFFFSRLCSDIGLANEVKAIGNGRFIQPDGDERYLVNEEILMNYTKQMKAELAEPIKTTIVQNQRSMTTWCLLKTKN